MIDESDDDDHEMDQNQKKVLKTSKQIQQAEQEKDSFGEGEGDYENWIEKFIKYGTLYEVTREAVTELIDKITVHGDMSIDIVFKYHLLYPAELFPRMNNTQKKKNTEAARKNGIQCFSSIIDRGR